MKKLIFIFALFLAVCITANAQTPYTGGTTTPKVATLSTTVIIPLSFTPCVTADGAGQILPDVVKGTTRDLQPDQAIFVFKATKDKDRSCSMNFSGSNTSGGLVIEGSWWWSWYNPISGQQYGGYAYPIIGNTTWGPYDTPPPTDPLDTDGNHTGYFYLKVDKLNATSTTCTNGVKRFTYIMSGSYVNL